MGSAFFGLVEKGSTDSLDEAGTIGGAEPLEEAMEGVVAHGGTAGSGLSGLPPAMNKNARPAAGQVSGVVGDDEAPLVQSIRPKHGLAARPVRRLPSRVNQLVVEARGGIIDPAKPGRGLAVGKSKPRRLRCRGAAKRNGEAENARRRTPIP